MACGLRVGMFWLAGLVYIDRELGVGFSKKERPWKTTKGQVIKEGRNVGQDHIHFLMGAAAYGVSGKVVRGKTVILMESWGRVPASCEILGRSAGVELTI